jgi:hypothetical protein
VKALPAVLIERVEVRRRQIVGQRPDRRGQSGRPPPDSTPLASRRGLPRTCEWSVITGL